MMMTVIDDDDGGDEDLFICLFHFIGGWGGVGVGANHLLDTGKLF